MTALAFANDSKYLFAGLGFWPLTQPGTVENLKGLENYEAVAFSPDGNYFATRFEGIITLWDYKGRRKEREFGHKSVTNELLEFSPDGLHIVSGLVHIDRRPYFIWNIKTGEPKYVPIEHFPSFDLSPDGTLVTAGVPGGIVLLRAADGRIAYTLVRQSDVPVKGKKEVAAPKRSQGNRVLTESGGCG